MSEIGAWMQQHVLLLCAIGIIIINFSWLMCCRKLLNMKWYAALIVAVLHDIIGYSAMRIMAIIEVGGNISQAANMRLFGAVFLLPLFYYLGAKIFKRDVKTVMDIAAICLVVGLIFGRIDCLLSGCCKGMLLPWSHEYRWPLREIELIYYVLFLFAYCPKILKGKTHGELYPWFMITYGALRFILEWLRVEYTTQLGMFHLAHIWSLISLGMGLSIYFELKSKKGKERK